MEKSALYRLIEEGPGLVGAKNPTRWAKPYLDVFLHEKANPESIFAWKDEESIEERLEIMSGLYMARGASQKKVAYLINLITLKAYTCAVQNGRQELANRRDLLAGWLSVQEGDNVEIAQIMTVSEAATNGQWA